MDIFVNYIRRLRVPVKSFILAGSYLFRFITQVLAYFCESGSNNNLIFRVFVVVILVCVVYLVLLWLSLLSAGAA